MHARADGYRDRGWPAGTPEDLLQRYFELLRGGNDLERMVACATDSGRHLRLREHTGGIGAALAEMTATQQLLLGRDPVDLGPLARVAVHREALLASRPYLPASIPAMWLRLGDVDRAEATIRSGRRAEPAPADLAKLAGVMAETGRPDRAKTMITEAVTGARAMTDRDRRRYAMLGVAAAAVGLVDPAEVDALFAEAERLSTLEQWPTSQVSSLTHAARVSADAGCLDRARRMIRRAVTVTDAIPETDSRTGALASIAFALATAGDLDEAEAIARGIEPPDDWDAQAALYYVARAAARSGETDRAAALAALIDDGHFRAMALAEVAGAAAAGGDPLRAGDIARSITIAGERAQALANIAHELIGVGDLETATALLDEAVTTLGLAKDTAAKDAATKNVGIALARAGHAGRGAALIRTLPRARDRAEAIALVAQAVAKAGDTGHATELMHEAERAAWTDDNVVPSTDREVMLVALTEAVAATGDLDRSLSVAALIVIKSRRELAVAKATQAAAANGDPARAEAVARAQLRPYWQTQALSSIAAGNPQRAGNLLRDAEQQAGTDAESLAVIAVAYVSAGDTARARTLLDQIELDASVIDDERAAVVRAFSAVGDLDRATRLLTTFEHDRWRCEALSGIALAAVETGDTHRAETLASDITDLAVATQEPYWPAQAHLMAAEIYQRCGADDRMHTSAALAEAFAHGITNDHARSNALADVARFAIATGRPDHAEAIRRAIPDPGRSARVLVALANAAPPDRTPHLVGEALCTGPWSAYVDLLPYRHPSVITTIADEVLATAPPANTTTPRQ
ncbi:tetratricopeptide repeat protein [Dactylosporangium salmoneum]